VLEVLTVSVQILILVVITYWSLDLSGRFWYILAVLCLYALIGTSLGVLLASATKVRMHPAGEGLQEIECAVSARLPLVCFLSPTNLGSEKCQGIDSSRPPSPDSSLRLFRLRRQLAELDCVDTMDHAVDLCIPSVSCRRVLILFGFHRRRAEQD
jgi:hypothetical protein